MNYALTGETNLGGLADVNGLAASVQNFNKSGTDWSAGNFFFGASTSFQDLVTVVQDFNSTLPPAGSADTSLGVGSTSLTTGSSTSLTVGTALALSASIDPTAVRIPEPGTVSLLAAGAAVILKRRRRR